MVAKDTGPMAPVYRRHRPPSIQTDDLMYEKDIGVARRNFLVLNFWKAALATFVLVGAVIFLQITTKDTDSSNFRSKNESDSAILGVNLSPGVTLRLDAPRTGTNFTFGRHSVEIAFENSCQSPRAWARLVGDALYAIPMNTVDGSIWRGNSFAPIEGKFRLQVKWTECNNAAIISSYTSPLDLTTTPESAGDSSITNASNDGLWLSSARFNQEKTINTGQSYIWHNPAYSNPQDATLLKASSSLGDSLVSKESTPIPDKFRELSNYELQCFVGSDSAASIRQAFLSIRPQLFSNQRPFKFHYYKVTSFSKPDQHWDDETKKRWRKCKNIVVSLDALDEAPLTMADYKRQVKTFLNHVMNAINDDTFPIWMVTVNESPMTAAPMCQLPSPITSSNHPCNDALFELWSESVFPPRIKLLDMTDLVNPQFGENQQDLLAVIAMRIYAVVGNQVAEWRRAGQIGKVDGLHRGGKVELNPKEVPYDWSSIIDT